MLEIKKMLTLSTCHITHQTANMLEQEGTHNRFPWLAVYEKAEFGFFLYINASDFTKVLTLPGNQIPLDLREIVQFTIDVGCELLCLDQDGEDLPYLPQYDW